MSVQVSSQTSASHTVHCFVIKADWPPEIAIETVTEGAEGLAAVRLQA
jgi:hypothetical protein